MKRRGGGRIVFVASQVDGMMMMVMIDDLCPIRSSISSTGHPFSVRWDG